MIGFFQPNFYLSVSAIVPDSLFSFKKATDTEHYFSYIFPVFLCLGRAFLGAAPDCYCFFELLHRSIYQQA